MHRSLIALALAAIVSQAAQAADLPYSHEEEIKQQRIVRLYVRTRVCLGDAGRALMRQGVREELVVRHFMVSVCGDPFYEQLRRDGMPEEQARRTLVELTKQALYEDILGQPIPTN